MRLEIAICTWNRAAALRRCLARLAAADPPEEAEWGILVVNNNCTDATNDVVAGFATRLPVRLVCEPRPGLSHARNRALDAAVGDYIAWIDDDVLVEDRWAGALCEAFRRWPQAAVFGGPVRADFEGIPPVWLQRTLSLVGSIYGMRSFGASPSPLALGGPVPFGCNMAFRLDVQRRYPYDPALGRRPGRPDLGDEETDVVEQMLRAGLHGWWVPEAGVRHVIPRQRQALRYVWSQCAGYGEYLARRDGPAAAPTWRGRARLWAQGLSACGWFLAGRVVLPPERWMRDLTIAAETFGRLRATRRRPGAMP